jgi:hypothetical protein
MYIFNHIPKTGGVSMYLLLQQLIGPDVLSPHIAINEEIEYHIDPNDLARYRIIYGHIGVVWNDIIGPNRRWMTLLRDPVDRVLSQYYFWRNAVPPSPHLPHVNAAQTLPLNEFLASRNYMVLQGNENVQTWFLADDLRARYRKVPPCDALALAKQNLAERFDFIGIADDYASSAQRLCRLLGVACPAAIPMENRTPQRKAMHEVEPETIASVRELNAMDLELYEFGKALASSGN